jgi:hypothetical protein
MTNPQLTRNLLDQLRQDSTDLSDHELAAMAQAGQAFDDLAEELDLYSFSDGKPIVTAEMRSIFQQCIHHSLRAV